MRGSHRSLAVLLLTLCVSSPLVSAKEKAPATMEEIHALIEAEDFKGAIKALTALTKAEPTNAKAWSQLGLLYHGQGQYDKAIAAYEAGESAGTPRWHARYNIACANALSGQTEAAFTALGQAVEAGFSDLKLLREDSDLSSLRADRRFAAVVAQVERNSTPCLYDTRLAALDFWVGDWTVTGKMGKVVGENHIQRVLNGCAYLETWEGMGGMRGHSLNFFDPAAGVWKQDWVDGHGGTILYEGRLVNGAMVLEGEQIQLDGTVSLSRMTLTPNADGTVTQLIEDSEDQGKTWKTGWELTYTRSAAAP